jgi:glycosyltransferase involved in cell wall biosynthesis
MKDLRVIKYTTAGWRRGNEYNHLMRILFVADGRSPISLNWMRYFAERGDEVHLASTFACEVDFPVKRLEFTPVAFSSVKRQNPRAGNVSSRTLGLRTRIRQWFGPLTIPCAARKLRSMIQEIQPDIVHAMRIPYEGMLAASALNKLDIPLLVSIWGNDFTLHAPSTPLMKHYTHKTMSATHALHADCARDVRLAREWGLDAERPAFVAPGNGGIKKDVFYPPHEPVKAPVVINPRGFRAYVQNDAFFRAIPLVLEKYSDARFVCSSMQGEARAMQWVSELNIEHAVQLDPIMPHAQMAQAFRSAQILVSPAIHDGTPNSLLEGMACGCFPIAGDLESIREWITHAHNGLLMDPNEPRSIADAILLGLEREDLRREAAGLNDRIISARAEYRTNMKRAGEFYASVISGP